MHLLLVPLLTLATLLVNPLPQADWTVYSSAEGQFSAAMPVDTRTNLIVTQTKEGPLYTHTVSANDNDTNEYMVSWTSYSSDVEFKGTDKIFDRVRDALIISKGGKLVNESAINLLGRPGRAITLTDSEGRIVKARFCFIGNRFYQVMVQNGNKNNSADSERFLESFKVQGG